MSLPWKLREVEWIRRRAAPFLLLCHVASPIFGGVFTPPLKITDEAAKYQLSRTADSMMAFDNEGTLHVTYWSGRSVTNPAIPSYIYYRSWRLDSGWSAQQSIDDSVSGGSHVGGRHPTLAVMPGGAVWIAWHDHRHCTEAGNWIDNIEIYGDTKPSGGSFSTSDIRFTTSDPSPGGKNGDTPKLAVDPVSGRISLCWYDFENDDSISDVYLKSSDANGVFDLSETMASMRSTNLDDRSGTPAYTVPDLAVDGSGTRHLVWAGGSGPGVDLYYAEAAATTNTLVEQVLAAGGTDFFDPPHIEVAPGQDVWIAYADDAAAGGENIVLLRRRPGQAFFDAPINAVAGAARETSPDLALDSLGRVHLVWIDERNGRHVYCGVYDPASGGLVSETKVTVSSGNWIRPTIVLDSLERECILFEEELGLVAGAIWFATKAVPNGLSAGVWSGYE